MAEINLIKLSQSGGPSLVDVNFNGTLEGQADTTIPVNVNLTDGVNPVVPTSVALTGNDLDIVIPGPVVPSGVLFQRPILQQYTSFATYDEGWRAQNGWNSGYIPPANPKIIAQLDYTLGTNYWYRLKDDLIVGGVSNKIRFVDVDGGQTWSATGNKNLITIDKLTGLGIYRGSTSALTWVNHLNTANSLSIVVNGITYDNFYLAALCEYLQIWGDLQAVAANVGIDPVSSATFASTLAQDYASSTTTVQTTTNYLNRTSMTAIVNSNKTGGPRAQYIFDATSLITAP
jgi:hypothetical protein